MGLLHFLFQGRLEHINDLGIWPQGNRGFTSVAIGNELAWKTCLILIFASSRGLRWLLEQPRAVQRQFTLAFNGCLIPFRSGQFVGCGLPLFSKDVCRCGLQVSGTDSIGGSLEPQKRQRWFSNDSQMLQSLSAVAGKMQPW